MGEGVGQRYILSVAFGVCDGHRSGVGRTSAVGAYDVFQDPTGDVCLGVVYGDRPGDRTVFVGNTGLFQHIKVVIHRGLIFKLVAVAVFASDRSGIANGHIRIQKIDVSRTFVADNIAVTRCQLRQIHGEGASVSRGVKADVVYLRASAGSNGDAFLKGKTLRHFVCDGNGAVGAFGALDDDLVDDLFAVDLNLVLFNGEVTDNFRFLFDDNTQGDLVREFEILILAVGFCYLCDQREEGDEAVDLNTLGILLYVIFVEVQRDETGCVVDHIGTDHLTGRVDDVAAAALDHLKYFRQLIGQGVGDHGDVIAVHNTQLLAGDGVFDLELDQIAFSNDGAAFNGISVSVVHFNGVDVRR